MIFHKEKLIRFSHCDPAGIGFYPRYVELINEVVEDWFQQGLGVPFRELHETHRQGIPTVKLVVDYLAPSRYGDRLDFRLRVLRLGNSSLTLEVAAASAGSERLRAELTVVLVGADLRPQSLDGFWRPRLEPFLAAEVQP